MKEITLRVPEELVPELEALAKKLAILVAGTDEDLSADDYDTSFREAILELIKDSVIRKPRDYAWIMAAINDGYVDGAEPFFRHKTLLIILTGWELTTCLAVRHYRAPIAALADISLPGAMVTRWRL